MSLSISPLAPRPTPPPAARPDAEPPQPAVTDAERRVLAQQFPEAPALALRLYGPSGALRTATPTAVGAHLDLRG